MDPVLKTYDPKENVLNIAGYEISGYAEDSAIEVSRTDDTWSTEVGVDGEVTRVRNRSKKGQFKITLAQSSRSNDILSALAARDELDGTGWGPALLKDMGGATMCFAPAAWVVKPANVGRNKSTTPNEWIIETGELHIFNGGTGLPLPNLP